MNEKFKAAVPPTPEEIEDAIRRGVNSEDSFPAAPLIRTVGEAATIPTEEEKLESLQSLQYRNYPEDMGPDAAK